MGKTIGRILSTAAWIGASLIFPPAAIMAVKSGVALLGLGPSAPKPDTSETAVKRRRPTSTLTV